MNVKRSSASRGELTKAMSATIQTVRKHEMQIEAMLAGIKQLMDGQAALGEVFEALKLKNDGMLESLGLLDDQVHGLISARPNVEKALAAIRVPTIESLAIEVYETLIVLSENVQKLREQQEVLLQRMEMYGAMVAALVAQQTQKQS